MAHLPNDAFLTDGSPMSLDAAVELIIKLVPPTVDSETATLFDAQGRYLAEPLVAPIDLPVFDNAAVDGYAVRWQELTQGEETRMPIVARVAAGHELDKPAPPGSALRIFTGAAVPAGFDTIFMQEDCRLLNNGQVLLPPGLEKGANLRPRGEDIARGNIALPAGSRLMPEDIALAAALGVPELAVRRRLKAAIFSTGDEISSPGTPLPPAGIYDANRFMLHAMLQRFGLDVVDLGILPDNRANTRRALGAAAEAYDLVLTSGGVSMGEEDHVKAVIEELGSLSFWKLAIKPGRSVAMGILQGTPFIGLPGNPVAVFVSFAALVRPLIAALNGVNATPLPRQIVVSASSMQKKEGRREYFRASLRQDEAGKTIADIYGTQSSGAITSLTRTQGLIELPEDITQIVPGDPVSFIDYDLIR